MANDVLIAEESTDRLENLGGFSRWSRVGLAAGAAGLAISSLGGVAVAAPVDGQVAFDIDLDDDLADDLTAAEVDAVLALFARERVTLTRDQLLGLTVEGAINVAIQSGNFNADDISDLLHLLDAVVDDDVDTTDNANTTETESSVVDIDLDTQLTSAVLTAGEADVVLQYLASAGVTLTAEQEASLRAGTLTVRALLDIVLTSPNLDARELVGLFKLLDHVVEDEPVVLEDETTDLHEDDTEVAVDAPPSSEDERENEVEHEGEDD